MGRSRSNENCPGFLLNGIKKKYPEYYKHTPDMCQRLSAIFSDLFCFRTNEEGTKDDTDKGADCNGKIGNIPIKSACNSTYENL